MRSVNGQFYKQHDDTMIKIYRKGISIDVVKNERELAKKALVLGIPTLIPFEICTVGDRYGLIYEATDTSSMAKLITDNPDAIENYAARLARFLIELHTIEVSSDIFPSIKEKYREWMAEAKD